MRHEVTPEMESILREFEQLVTELQIERVESASAAVRAEWHAFLNQWPSKEEVEGGVVQRSLDDLTWMLAKLKRFHALVNSGRA
jgi:hypothetical protein